MKIQITNGQHPLFHQHARTRLMMLSLNLPAVHSDNVGTTSYAYPKNYKTLSRQLVYGSDF